MNFCSNTNSALFFSSVDKISDEIWRNLDCESNVYFHRSFLKAIEENHPDIIFSYIILIDKDKKPIAFASIQIVDFYIDTIKNDIEILIRKLKNIGRKFHIIPDKKPLKLLICGNTFVSGEHGIFIKQKQDKKLLIKKLAKAILHFSNADKKLKIDAFLLKDFINESLLITDELKDFNYHPFSVEPNMVLTLDENWQNFDDYLASMKTKFRVKARKAHKQSAAITIEEVTKEDLVNQLPEMTALYKKVASNADFNLGNFNLETYTNLKEKFGENYILKTYWLNHKIVGFISGVINQNSLDAHFVGIDYELNREYAIYQRMLYDYIEIAISKRLKTINFGRTASEIKSSVGAEPRDLTMYFRHKKSITNRILKLFLQRIQPTPFHQKFPFKNANNPNEE
ncbi:GNAT family N-acetyltransferase [Polaribacter filamentus]|uniref:GNAT family N-acetyltransferase n=1 Tax=Polaribacter filamentus TaxID=53483 RepID=A0A2S7L041_9FLAO|nr:peptidogalycan biosysnthesis protein [Polaribacter filamentus]PQB08282.1 GNAT family N-acetyltransferase [Polaribacter filamentus]